MTFFTHLLVQKPGSLTKWKSRQVPFVLFIALALFISANHVLGQNITIIGDGISPPNPEPGVAFSLSVTYVNDATYQGPTSWLVAFSSDGTTIVGCPAAGQVFLVDNKGVNVGDAGTNGSAMGWGGPSYELGVGPVASDAVSTVAPITFVQTWNLSVPTVAAYGGSYNLDIGVGTNYVACGQNFQNGMEVHIPISIPVPPATIVSVDKVAEGGSAATNDLVLFTVSYDFVNSPAGNTVTDTVPVGVTVVQMGPVNPVTTSETGTLPGSTLTWNIPGSGVEEKGQVWFLARVTAASGTISNTAKLNLGSGPSATSNVANSTVGGGGFSLIKSQSSSNLVSGQAITYTLAYSINGFSLQWYDSYDNGPADGNANGGIGYDGTTYQNFKSVGGTGDGTGTGGFVIETDSQGNRYLVATSAYSTSGGDYPMYLRSGGANFCPGNTYVVEGDMQIPTSAQGVSYGADADLVVGSSVQGAVTYTYLAGISLDNNPYGYIQMQDNECPGSCPAGGAGLTTYGGVNGAVTIQAGVWYTVRVIVTVSAGGPSRSRKSYGKGEIRV